MTNARQAPPLRAGKDSADGEVMVMPMRMRK